jgi:hypothetical protein
MLSNSYKHECPNSAAKTDKKTVLLSNKAGTVSVSIN